MTERNETVAQILEIELEMFLAVNGEDNTSCQEHPDAFKLHRRAQFAAWSLPTLKSYLDDLARAQRLGGVLAALGLDPGLLVDRQQHGVFWGER